MSHPLGEQHEKPQILYGGSEVTIEPDGNNHERGMKEKTAIRIVTPKGNWTEIEEKGSSRPSKKQGKERAGMGDARGSTATKESSKLRSN